MRTILASAAVLLIAGPAFAFQCPADAAAIDEALASSDASEDVKAEAQALRDEGMSQHEAGDHEAAVETLAQAKELLGIE